MLKSKIIASICTGLFLLPATGMLMSVQPHEKPAAYNFDVTKIYPYQHDGFARIYVKLTRTDDNIPYIGVKTCSTEKGKFTRTDFLRGTSDSRVLEGYLRADSTYLYEGITYFRIFTFTTYEGSGEVGFTVPVKESTDLEDYVIDANKYDTPVVKFDNFAYFEGHTNMSWETFNFQWWDTLFFDETYYRIDLEQIYFGYSCPFMGGKLPQTAEAVITINDPGGYMSYIQRGSSRKRFYLTPHLSKGRVTCVSDYTFYVDPDTFVMYETQLAGTVPTKYIYLPKHKYQDDLTFSYNVKFYDIGVNEVDINYSYSRQISKRLVGNCVNSQYCVIGEQSSDHFQGGQIIEVTK